MESSRIRRKNIFEQKHLWRMVTVRQPWGLHDLPRDGVMTHPKLGRCPNQKWMRTLTTQESPDFMGSVKRTNRKIKGQLPTT